MKIKKCWHHLLYADVISFFVTGKYQKIRKIDENSWYWRRKSEYLQNNLKGFNETFMKKVTYDNIKSHKKPGFHPLSRRYIFGKITGGSQIASPQSLLRIKSFGNSWVYQFITINVYMRSLTIMFIIFWDFWWLSKFSLWWKENLLNHQKVSKYYEHDFKWPHENNP